jgi:hypothetical protein
MARPRAEKLLTPRAALIPFEKYPDATKALVDVLLACESGEAGGTSETDTVSSNPPVIVYVSKMFAVSRQCSILT